MTNFKRSLISLSHTHRTLLLCFFLLVGSTRTYATLFDVHLVEDTDNVFVSIDEDDYGSTIVRRSVSYATPSSTRRFIGPRGVTGWAARVEVHGESVFFGYGTVAYPQLLVTHENEAGDLVRLRTSFFNSDVFFKFDLDDCENDDCELDDCDDSHILPHAPLPTHTLPTGGHGLPPVFGNFDDSNPVFRNNFGWEGVPLSDEDEYDTRRIVKLLELFVSSVNQPGLPGSGLRKFFGAGRPPTADQRVGGPTKERFPASISFTDRSILLTPFGATLRGSAAVQHHYAPLFDSLTKYTITPTHYYVYTRAQFALEFNATYSIECTENAGSAQTHKFYDFVTQEIYLFELRYGQVDTLYQFLAETDFVNVKERHTKCFPETRYAAHLKAVTAKKSYPNLVVTYPDEEDGATTPSTSSRRSKGSSKKSTKAKITHTPPAAQPTLEAMPTLPKQWRDLRECFERHAMSLGRSVFDDGESSAADMLLGRWSESFDEFREQYETEALLPDVIGWFTLIDSPFDESTLNDDESDTNTEREMGAMSAQDALSQRLLTSTQTLQFVRFSSFTNDTMPRLISGESVTMVAAMVAVDSNAHVIQVRRPVTVRDFPTLSVESQGDEPDYDMRVTHVQFEATIGDGAVPLYSVTLGVFPATPTDDHP